MSFHQALAEQWAQYEWVKEVDVKVQDVMTSPAHSCTPDSTLVEAARTMWDDDCGALPVLDNAGRPAGMITDRDICMAVARKNRFPGDIRIREVMSPHPFVCKPGDEIASALQTMGKQQVRRLPVVDARGCLVGIVSINDVAAGTDSGTEHGADEIHRKVVETFLSITRAPQAASSMLGVSRGSEHAVLATSAAMALVPSSPVGPPRPR